MAEKKIIVDIDIKADDIRAAKEAQDAAAKSMRLYQQEVNALKTQQKEINALYKVGAIDSKEYAKQQTDVKVKLAETNKGLREANKTMINNKTVVDAAKGSNEQLRARLSLLTKEYNGLSKNQRENSKNGQQLGTTIKALSDKLKANEKAVGDNRRNVGNYEEALKGAAGQINIMGVNLGGLVGQLRVYKDGVMAAAAAQKASAVATGGLSGALQILKVALISTGIGAIVVAIGSLIAFLTQTKRGSELVSQAMSGLGAVVSVLTDRFSSLGEGLIDAFNNPKQALKDLGELIKSQIVNRFTAIPALLKAAGDGFRALANRDIDGMKKAAIDAGQAVIQLNTGLDPAQQKKIADGFKGVANEIGNEAKEAALLEKRMQKLRDAERELLVETSKRKAEVAELQLIAEDETNSYKVRGEAIKKANAIQEANMKAELDLQKERVAIIQQQMDLSENLEEDEQKLAEERAKLGDIEAANIKKLRTLKAKENSITKQEAAAIKKIQSDKIKLSEDEIKAQEKAQAEIIKGYEDERSMIDELSSIEKNKAIASIANEEERFAKIAYLTKEALLQKIRSIEDETAAETASSDAIGTIDQEKYAKQLAQKSEYEAQIAEMDRAAAAEAFSAKIALLSLDEQLENDAAELSIDNEKELAIEKAKISIKFLETKLALMTAFAKADGELTDEELKNLQLLENAINKIKNGLGEESDVPSLAEALGLTDDELSAAVGVAQAIASTITGILQIAMQANQSRIDGIDALANAEINAIESSTLSEEKKADKIKAIEKKAAMEKYQLELKNFNLSKGLQITNAIIGTAQAAIAAYSSGAAVPIAGVALGPAMAAIAAAFGAVQIGFIASQKPPPPPKFADGGILSGASHARGGIQLYGNSGDYYGEAEGGEPILTKGVSRNPYLLQKASEINVAAGGKPLVKSSYMAAGGIASPTFAARQASTNNNAQLEFQIASLGDRIEQMQPVVRVTDINRINGQAVRVQQSANL